jgi:autotransporter-associated beta strand protein
LGGPGGLIKTGSGVATLAGLNTYTGGTTVTDGTLLVANGNALPTTGSVTIGANGILENGSGAANTIVDSVSGAGGMVIDAGSGLTANSINLGSLVIGGTAGSPAIVTIAASDANGNPLTAMAASTTSAAAAHAMAGFLKPATPITASASTVATATALASTTASWGPPSSVAVAPSSHESTGSASAVKSKAWDSLGLIALQLSSETGGVSELINSASNESERSSSHNTTGISLTSDAATFLDRQTATIANGMGELRHGDSVAAAFADADVLEWAASSPPTGPSTDADISLLSDELLDAIGRQLQN